MHSVHRKHIAATCIALCCTSHSALRALCSYAHTVAHVITPVSLSIPLVHFVHWAHDLHPPPAVHFVHRGSMAVHMPSMQVGALGASHRHVVSPLVSGPPIALLHLVHLCPLGRYGACTVHGAPLSLGPLRCVHCTWCTHHVQVLCGTTWPRVGGPSGRQP